MSNRLFQGVIHQMKDAVDRTIGVLDENGTVISCSELDMIGTTRPDVRDEFQFAIDIVRNGGYTYRSISNDARLEYLIFVEGEDAYAEKQSLLIAISLGNIKNLYDEKYDKNSFIKNVILDNILPSDIYAKTKELHFASDVYRIVYLIKFGNAPDANPIDLLSKLFPDKNRDYIISISETSVVLVSEVAPDYDQKDIEQKARDISDTVQSEFYSSCSVGIGSAVENIKDLARSYKEAQVAIEVGKVFETEKNILSYENLGVGRLIYQLPNSLCELFLQEVFKRDALDALDSETLMTIQAFFENNLNVSETSRQLFVHRNTLVYRLERIRKITGLDLREFEEAVTFKIALMVKKYLSSKSEK